MNKKVGAQLLFLGTGSSMGIPVIGCSCSVCSSRSSFNKRLRPSALISVENKKILIDAGQDYRTQALRYQVNDLDGVMFTHAHYDHTAGIDDLRVYYLRDKEPLPCLLSQATANELLNRFNYIFCKDSSVNKLRPKFVFQILKEERGFAEFLCLQVSYLTFEQIGMPVNGYRLGNLAYISDIRHYPETIFEDLQGVRHLVLSALRYQPSPMHFSLDEAIDFAERVGARQTWLTHIAHEVDHEEGNSRLPSNVRLAYDGLVIEFEAEKVI
jgi:phosphoribosyl 1,2-cyclic phosphate phosphodiesterase